MESSVTLFIFTVLHISKNMAKWTFGSSSGEPLNWFCWTMLINAGFSSKLLALMVWRATRVITIDHWLEIIFDCRCWLFCSAIVWVSNFLAALTAQRVFSISRSYKTKSKLWDIRIQYLEHLQGMQKKDKNTKYKSRSINKILFHSLARHQNLVCEKRYRKYTVSSFNSIVTIMVVFLMEWI